MVVPSVVWTTDVCTLYIYMYTYINSYLHNVCMYVNVHMSKCKYYEYLHYFLLLPSC